MSQKRRHPPSIAQPVEETEVPLFLRPLVLPLAVALVVAEEIRYSRVGRLVATTYNFAPIVAYVAARELKRKCVAAVRSSIPPYPFDIDDSYWGTTPHNEADERARPNVA